MHTPHYPSSFKWIVPTTIRSQLLVSVHMVLFLLVAVGLAWDYHREMARRVSQRQAALQEESATLLISVSEITRHERDPIQDYVDAVCAKTNEVQSPGHHIVVEWNGDTIQAMNHDRPSPQLLTAIKAALVSQQASNFEDAKIVVGMSKRDDTTVYVVESLADIRSTVRGETVHRSLRLFGMAVVAAVVVNLVVGHFVTRPLRRLVAIVRMIGRGELGIQTKLFHSDELNYLATEINSMSRMLARNDRERKAQMAKARSIQRDLLPQVIEIPGVTHRSLFQPADDVGGDYYDILPLGDGNWLICIADVAGHGIPAAMTAAIVKSLLIEAVQGDNSPADVLGFINRRLIAISPNGNFVTMALARYGAASQSLVFASAGHETAFLQHIDTQIEELNSTGLILGVSEDALWTEVTIQLQEGSRLILVTDGVTETFDANHSMFGRDRVRNILRQSSAFDVEIIVTQLEDTLKSFRAEERQQDDVTVVAMSFSQTDRAPSLPVDN